MFHEVKRAELRNEKQILGRLDTLADPALQLVRAGSGYKKYRGCLGQPNIIASDCCALLPHYAGSTVGPLA